MFHFRFFNIALLIIFVISHAKEDNFQQGLFHQIGKCGLLKENVISSHHVYSLFECGQRCLLESVCTTFNHRSVCNTDQINCQLSTSADSQLYNLGNSRDWTLYTIIQPLQIKSDPKIPEPSEQNDICSENNHCQNGGTCIPDKRKKSGFRCECDRKFYGKNCEFK